MNSTNAPRLHRVSISIGDEMKDDLHDLAELLNRPVAELIHSLAWTALRDPTIRALVLEGKQRRARRAADAATARDLAKILNQAH